MAKGENAHRNGKNLWGRAPVKMQEYSSNKANKKLAHRIARRQLARATLADVQEELVWTPGRVLRSTRPAIVRLHV